MSSLPSFENDMAYKVDLAHQAMADMELIYEKIEADTSDAAEHWYRALELAISTLSDLPQRCPVTPERSHLRHLLYGNKPHIYRIIFEIDELRNMVTVAQIRHGARGPISQ